MNNDRLYRKEKATGIPTPARPKSAYPPKAVRPWNGKSEATYKTAVKTTNAFIFGLFHIDSKSHIPNPPKNIA